MGEMADYYMNWDFADDEYVSAPSRRPRRYRQAPVCKFHGCRMVRRVNRHTKEEFWGCREFPECKETKAAVQACDVARR
jgi:ssDNA-binding Zn-finger/Zn-ribbon topoisomerase 1